MVALEPLASELVAPRFKQSSDDWKEVFVVPQRQVSLRVSRGRVRFET